MRNSFVFNARVYKNTSFCQIVLKLKSWIMISKDFEFLDIFIESKWGVFPYLHLCFKVININKCTQYPRLGKGLQKEKTKFLRLIIDYPRLVIDYKPLYTPLC